MEEISGYFDDDGNELNPNFFPKLSLCLICKLNETEDEFEEILCNLTRFDQVDGKEFKCFAYRQKKNHNNRNY
jgi:hypothetical protein